MAPLNSEHCVLRMSVNTTRCLIFMIVMRTEGTETRDNTLLLKCFYFFFKQRNGTGVNACETIQCSSLHFEYKPVWIENS